jgi:hypothetical protein
MDILITIQMIFQEDACASMGTLVSEETLKICTIKSNLVNKTRFR